MPFVHVLVICLFVSGCAAESQVLVMEEGGQHTTEVDLWTKATDLAGKNLRWEAGKRTIRMEIKDGDGKVEQTHVWFYERKPSPDGGVIEELVRATENSEDVTAAKRKEEAKSRPDALPVKEEKNNIQVRLYTNHPFHPDDQKSVRVERTAETRYIQGQRCLGYKFRFDQEGDSFTSGLAWLEAQTGVPFEVRFTQRPLPPHTKDLITTIRFEHTSEGVWRTKDTRSETKATFMFWTKYFVNIQEFSDYWLRKEQVEGVSR